MICNLLVLFAFNIRASQCFWKQDSISARDFVCFFSVPAESFMLCVFYSTTNSTRVGCWRSTTRAPLTPLKHRLSASRKLSRKQMLSDTCHRHKCSDTRIFSNTHWLSQIYLFPSSHTLVPRHSIDATWLDAAGLSILRRCGWAQKGQGLLGLFTFP